MGTARMLLCAVATTLAGCGGTVESNPHDSPTGGSGGHAPACSYEAGSFTQSGPCAAAGMECGQFGSTSCGTCTDGDSCFQNRCYSPIGSAPDTFPALMRGLFSQPEGTRCVAPEAGALEAVEVALWDSNITAITMDVYLPCGSEMQKAASVTLPASAFPVYDGIHGEMRGTTFVVDPSLTVKTGDTVDVMFHAEGASQYSKSAVSGIYTGDLDPNCKFASYDGYPGIGVDPNWDFMARLYIHR